MKKPRNHPVDNVFIVVKDLPYVFEEIEKVFSDWDAAANYIEDQHPYFTYYSDQKFWTFPDLSDADLEMEERYRIIEKPLVS